MACAALLLGAGRGARFAAAGGAQPKALAPLAGRPLLLHALQKLLRAPEIERVQAVLSPAVLAEWPKLRAQLSAAASAAAEAKLAAPVAGGASRQASVQAGLNALPPQRAQRELVAVHDAARPLLSAAALARVIAAARAHGAACLAVPVADTLHQISGDEISATPPRAQLRAAQTPQVFRREWLAAALSQAAAEGASGTDCAALVARSGRRVKLVAGDSANLKITTAQDLQNAEAVLKYGAAAEGPAQ